MLPFVWFVDENYVVVPYHEFFFVATSALSPERYHLFLVGDEDYITLEELVGSVASHVVGKLPNVLLAEARCVRTLRT